MNENPIKWLKKIREQKHLSTYEVARLSGVSQSHYAMIENRNNHLHAARRA